MDVAAFSRPQEADCADFAKATEENKIRAGISVQIISYKTGLST
jgi:hypothetical protein